MTQIPGIAAHRVVGIHACQSPARVKIVTAAIDRVARMSDILELADFAADPQQPPEARMFAANKVQVEYEVAAEERRNRPIVDLEKVRATVAGLDSLEWRSPVVYGTDLEDGGVPREERLAVEECRCSRLVASIQNNSGLPQGPAGTSAAVSACGKLHFAGFGRPGGAACSR